MNVDIEITSPTANSSTIDVSSARVSKNDTITWLNSTGDDVILLIPHPGLGDGQGHVFRSIHDGDSEKVKITKSTLGRYRYGIFCFGTNSFATGSDPEIIIVP